VLRRPLAILAVVLALAASLPSASLAQEGVAVAGILENGSPVDSFDPTQVTVTLRVLEGTVVVDQQAVRPNAEGLFLFDGVQPTGIRTYFISVEYQGAIYSETRQLADLDQPVTLTVYEATLDPTVLATVSHTIIVTGADATEGVVEILERVSIANRSGSTLVPDLSSGMLGFLRFALPAESFNLDVRSDLVGGQILQVDRGFALTTPVPPTTDALYHVEFVYRVPYEGEALDISRTLRFGAETIRVVVPVNVALGISSTLANLGIAPFEGQDIQLLEAFDMPPDTPLDLQLDGLPKPPLLARFGRNVSNWYLAAGVPALMGIALLVAVVIGVRRRSTATSFAAQLDPAVRRERLLQELADLESRSAEGTVSQRRYASQRQELKGALVELDVRAHLAEVVSGQEAQDGSPEPPPTQ
jgi:hypothetical protein